MKKQSTMTLQNYLAWLKEEHKSEDLHKYRLYYENERDSIMVQFIGSDFWKGLMKILKDCHDEYYLSTERPLLIHKDYQPVVVAKEYKSFIEKTYRKNILDNSGFPREPKSGWFLPNNWFSRINDIVRTKIIVNYLDGMNFLSKKIKSYCRMNKVSYEINWDGRFDGYYSINSYFKNINFEIIEKSTGKLINQSITIELQITTQIQDLLRNLLHKEYEKTRLQTKIDKKWMWNYQDDKFSTAYLAHILHYAEGKVMDVFEKNTSEEESWKKNLKIT